VPTGSKAEWLEVQVIFPSGPLGGDLFDAKPVTIKTAK
jgi:hypothetical protein